VGRDPLKTEDHQINNKAIQTIIQDVGHYAYCGLNLSKSYVVGTFEFLISAHPNPKPTTLGIPLGGQPDKTRHPPLKVRFYPPLKTFFVVVEVSHPTLEVGHLSEPV
jgi:hypothetical protein